MQSHLIIFIKNPVRGRVKTRLAATIGAERALEVYQKLLTITRNAAFGVPCEKYLYYADAVEVEDEWDEASFHKRIQSGNDLGERMHNAFADAFAHGAAKAVIIGSDCPGLSSAHIERAFSALDGSDVVIGPAADGGYYLLGMKAFHAEFFAGKHWSTDSMLHETLADIERLALLVDKLPTLSDLDDEDDLNRWMSER